MADEKKLEHLEKTIEEAKEAAEKVPHLESDAEFPGFGSAPAGREQGDAPAPGGG